jgi:DNA-binding response OmpR family regulator
VAARLHALLRRRPARPDGRLEAGDLVVDTAAARATRGGRDLELTRRELELLALFVRRPGEILTRREMHEEVWGYTFDPGTNVADVFVGYLRRKLEADGEPRILHTVRGVGFVLRP